MRRILTVVVLLAAISAQAQQIKITGETVIKQEGQMLAHPVLHPSGDYMACTTPGYKGLWLYKASATEGKQVSAEAGAGYSPVFASGQEVLYYRKNEFKGLKKYSSLHAFDYAKGSHQVLQEAARFVSAPALSNGRLVYQQDGQLKKITVDVQKAENTSWADVRTEGKRIKLTEDGERQYLTPKGEGHYLWVSFSPDQSKILFTFAGEGTFVCNKQGKILRKVGYLNAPVWLTNDFIAGMRDQDDGHRITASDIFVVSLKGELERNITQTKNTVEMYPTASRDGKRLAFHTQQGVIKVLDIEIIPKEN